MSPDASRAAALLAARELLIEGGPQAVTLKAVAGRIGRTHANVLHHFGSAAGLQKALVERMARTICETIGEAVIARRAGVGTPRKIVDLTFDAFDKEGGGALASWMLLSGNEDALDPIIGAIHDLVEKLHDGTDSMREVTLTLCLLALGDTLMGGPLTEALGISRDTARDTAEALLEARLAKPGSA